MSMFCESCTIASDLPTSSMLRFLVMGKSGHYHDLRLCDVEVTASVDQITEQTKVAILDSKKEGPVNSSGSGASINSTHGLV